MSRDLYRALSAPEEAETLSEDARWLSLLARTAAEVRAWKAGSLAQAELTDGLWVEDPQAAEEPVRLAAADGEERDWPVTYRGGGWEVVLSLGTDGVPYAVITEGDGLATLHIGDVLVDLEAGEEAVLETLDAPPDVLSLTDESGARITLSAEDPV